MFPDEFPEQDLYFMLDKTVSRTSFVLNGITPFIKPGYKPLVVIKLSGNFKVLGESDKDFYENHIQETGETYNGYDVKLLV